MAKRTKKVASRTKKTTTSKSRKTPASTRAKTKPRKRSGIQVVERPSSIRGIEELVWAEASSLSENPENWKTHPKRQLDALESTIDAVGWAGTMLYNRTTGRLIDGHGRKQLSSKYPIVPVLLGNWTEAEERQILLNLDPIAAMFETDSTKLKELTERHSGEVEDLLADSDDHAKEVLAQLNSDLQSHADVIDYGGSKSFLPDFAAYDNAADNPNTTEGTHGNKGEESVNMEDAKGELPGAFTLKTYEETPPDAFGPTAFLSIPYLRPDKIATIPPNFQTWVGPETPEADAYFYIYGCAAIEKVRSSNMLVAFYTWDQKFESVWNDPTKFTARMLNFKVYGVITPDYSCYDGGHLAEDLWNTFRSRWLGRYWQESGLDVIPNIPLSNFEHDIVFQWRMAGLPQDIDCISTQVQAKGTQNVDAFYANHRRDLLKVIKHLNPKQVLLYHGPNLPKDFCRDFTCEIIKVKSWMWERGKVLKEKDYLTKDK